MTWASERRLDYIDWHLATHGEVQRADIIAVFGVTSGQSTLDLAAFQTLYPDAVAYHGGRRRYVPQGRYRRRRAKGWGAAINWAHAPGNQLDRV